MKKTPGQTLSLFRSTVSSMQKKIVTSLLGIIFISTSFAANYYNATGAANANNIANWTTDPGGAAGTAPADFVSGDVFTIRTGTTINTNAAWTVSGTGSGIVIEGTLTLSNPLTINGGFTNNGSFNNGNQLVTIGTGGNIAGTGTITFFNLTINTTNTTDIVTLSKTLITIRGGNGAANGRLTLNQGIFKVGAGNTINFNNNSSENSINNPNATGTSNFATTGANGEDGGKIVALTGSGASFSFLGTGLTTLYDFSIGTATGQGNRTVKQTNPNVFINGTLTLQDNQAKWQTNSPVYGAASTFVRNNNNQQYNPGGNDTKEWLPTGPATIGVAPGYPNNVTITNIGTSAGGFNNGNGWVPNTTLAINGVFTLGDNTTNAQVDFSNVPSFTCGGFVLNTNSRFTAPKTTMTVKGNWTDNQAVSGNNRGFFINGTSTVVFSGAGTCDVPNTITGPGANAETFYNLTVAANLSLLSPVTLNAAGVFTLTSGILTTTATNILTINNTATNAVTGGSTSSYINGPVKWNLAAAANNYNFPVGSGTCVANYLPLALNKAASNAATVTVQAFTPGSGGTVDGTMSSLSTTEYWSLITTDAITGSSVSVARQTAITPLAYIAESTTAAGIYTSLGGTAVANGVNNSNDIGSGTSLFFSLGTPPIVSTLAATSITTTGATLQGAFNTQGASHGTSFNYGPTTAYGSTVNTAHSPINSTSSVPDSAVITGLTPNTEYHYVATDGVNSGSDVRFMTAPNAPTVGAPSNPTGSSFTASWSAPTGQGNAAFTYTIQVSTDPTFATGVITQTGIASGTASVSVTGLTSGTTYYYQVKAVNAYASSAWSATSGSITTNLVPTPPCDNNTSNDGATSFINTAPVVDGTIDAVWSQTPSNPMNIVTLGNNNNTQTWKSLWTVDSLYLLVQVTDASLIGQGGGLAGSVAVPGVQQGTSGNYYEADGIEFYLDPDNSHGNNYDGVNDVQIRFNLGSTSLSGQSAGGAAQFVGAAFQRDAPLINWKIQVVTGGYLLEAAIPWGKDNANPGIFLLPNATYGTPTNNQTIGLDIGVNDQDNAGVGRQAQIQWFGNSPTSFQNPNQFKSVGLQLCPEPPVVVNPTKLTITATSADLGATVVSSGKDQQLNISPLTVRGTAYSTTTPVTSNAGAEGNTALGVYSGVRTGLVPQTKYYYVGYANNAAGLTGISSVDSFYTLSALPTVQPVLSATTCSSIILNWDAISFPPVDQASQTGYLILRRQDGTAPATTGIATRVATKQADLPAGTTLVATVSSGATLTYTDATAVAGTNYNYLLVPFTWDGVATDSTYNYFVTGAPGIAATIGTTITPAFDPVAAICAGANLNALPLVSTNNITGTWTPALDNTGTTTYTFTPAAGQCANTATLTITVNQSTAPAFNPVAPICTGGNLSALPLTSSNNITGTWSPALNNTATTTYTFTPAAGQCASTATLTITVSPLPIVSASANPTEVTQGSTVTLTGTSNATGVYSWTASPQTSIESSASLLAASKPAQNTTYTFTVTSEAGCSASDDVAVTIATGDCLNPPNIFTPNNDGFYDVWKVTPCTLQLRVDVYNRWGGLVFHSDNYDNKWNGTHNGKPVPDGTYYYVIRATYPGGKQTSVNGNVTIMR